jgi:hypothetical protein
MSAQPVPRLSARRQELEQRNAVLIDRYVAGEALLSIGVSVGLSRERVRQIVKASGVRMPLEFRCAAPGCLRTPGARKQYCHPHQLVPAAAAPTVALLRDQHGTESCYRAAGCRCDLCRRASADRRSARYHRTHPDWRYRSGQDGIHKQG